MSCQDAVSPKGARKLHDADVVYLYDGSFEGFLCCVYESFAQHELPFAGWTPQRETATLYPVKDISTASGGRTPLRHEKKSGLGGGQVSGLCAL